MMLMPVEDKLFGSSVLFQQVHMHVNCTWIRVRVLGTSFEHVGNLSKSLKNSKSGL